MEYISNQLAWKRNVYVIWSNNALKPHVECSKTNYFDHMLNLAIYQNESHIHGRFMIQHSNIQFIFQTPNLGPHTHTQCVYKHKDLSQTQNFEHLVSQWVKMKRGNARWQSSNLTLPTVDADSVTNFYPHL
jgi:hypothetical protein